MESWNYCSQGKGFMSDELNSSTNSPVRSKYSLLGWEFKNPCSFGDGVLLSGSQQIENQSCFGEPEFPQIVGKQLPEDGGRNLNLVLPTTNPLLGDDDSTSKLSGSVVDSNNRDSSLIDLKLGRFVDPGDAHSSKYSKRAAISSSTESFTSQKRARSQGVNFQTAFCQVYGCNKDLTSSKDYHKRHKVCEVHSKTAKVIVNGIEQRFCQQCSRFHLLVEFDDGKRSCRKRLAGHNERRRKPQVSYHSGRAQRLLQPYTGIGDSRFQEKSLTATSFLCKDILSGGLLHPEKFGANDWCKRIKVEGKNDYNSLSTTSLNNRNLNTKSPLVPYGYEVQIPPFHENGNAPTGNMLSETTCQYSHNMGGPHIGSHPLFHHSTTLASEDFGVFDAASTIQGLSEIPDSGCALSLLSSQSQNASSNPSISVISMHRAIIMSESQSHYGMSELSEKLMGVSSQASSTGISSKFASGISEAQMGRILTCESSDRTAFQIPDGVLHRSNLGNAKTNLSYECTPTIDLLQLSSQLQRVEHQRHSMQDSA